MRKSEVSSESEKVNCGKVMILPAGLKACFLFVSQFKVSSDGIALCLFSQVNFSQENANVERI